MVFTSDKPDLSLQKLVPVLVAYAPSGSSNKNLLHLLSIRNLTFLQYDYGPKENQVRYNSDTPPPYDLSNVRVPVSLYYGETDLLVTTKVGLSINKDSVRHARVLSYPN